MTTATTMEALASTLPPPPGDLPRQLRCCGAVLTEEEWRRLPIVGVQHFDYPDGESEDIELRNHACPNVVAPTTIARARP